MKSCNDIRGNLCFALKNGKCICLNNTDEVPCTFFQDKESYKEKQKKIREYNKNSIKATRFIARNKADLYFPIIDDEETEDE